MTGLSEALAVVPGKMEKPCRAEMLDHEGAKNIEGHEA
jgi:hypothetical protein